MYNKADLISACQNAIYPIEIEELEFRVGWSSNSNQFVLLFDQLDWYYSARGFCAGSRYIEKNIEIGVIPDGRQWILKELVEKFNREFEMDLSY